MGDLFPTKTRLALLDGIAAGEVTGYPYAGSDHVDYFYRDGSKLTAKVNEVMREGWVRKGKPFRDSPTSDFPVELTDLGRKVREEGRRG